MLSVGAAGSILGFGAGLFIIDDPIKSVAEAESKTLQRKLREWIGGTAKTRLEKRTNGLPPIMKLHTYLIVQLICTNIHQVLNI